MYGDAREHRYQVRISSRSCSVISAFQSDRNHDHADFKNAVEAVIVAVFIQ